MVKSTQSDGGPVLPSKYLTPVNLAEILGVPVDTIYQWRSRGVGPRGFRVGRHLRFDPQAVREWVQSLGEGVA